MESQPEQSNDVEKQANVEQLAKLCDKISLEDEEDTRLVTSHFPGVPLTTINLRKTCVSHIMRPIHE